MKAAKRQIKRRQAALVHIALAPRIEIYLERTEDAQLPAISKKLSIQLLDLSSLLLHLLFVDATGDLQSLRVVGDCHVLIAPLNGCLRHFGNRSLAVTPDAMHLQITLYLQKP